jgi:hypothetical protein
LSERFNVLSIRFISMAREAGAKPSAERQATVGATEMAELVAALSALGYEEKGQTGRAIAASHPTTSLREYRLRPRSSCFAKRSERPGIV